MVTVNFGSINSDTDLGLFLTSVKCSEPEPKRTVVDVPCRDGELDLSYAVSSDLHYKNRKLTLEFKKTDYTNSWMEVFSDIADQLHGKKMHVVISNDPEWYWDSFITVDPSSEYNVGTITVNLNAYPYKRQEYTRSYTSTAAGVAVALLVTKQTVVPTLSSDAAFTVSIDGGEEYSFEAGTYTDPDLKLSAGSHSMIIKGSGNIVTISYINGRF